MNKKVKKISCERLHNMNKDEEGEATSVDWLSWNSTDLSDLIGNNRNTEDKIYNHSKPAFDFFAKKVILFLRLAKKFQIKIKSYKV